MPLEKLAAGAVSLQHPGWLITNPVQAAVLHNSEIGVHIPQPARYAVHKLIIAQKRSEHSMKRFKDLRQASEFIEDSQGDVSLAIV